MAGARHHMSHRYNLNTQTVTATVAAPGDCFMYDAFINQGGGSTANPTTGFDSLTEQVVEMSLMLDTTLTGQATNYSSFRVTHRNSAGTTKNLIQIICLTNAFVITAFIPNNLNVANGAAIPGAAAGTTLTVTTGTKLPWTLVPGDSVTLDMAITGNGQYTGGISLNFIVSQYNV